MVGTGIEELFRFVPQLRASGVEAVVDIFRTICVIGGDEGEVEKAKLQQSRKSEAAALAAAAVPAAGTSADLCAAPLPPPQVEGGPMPMDTDAASTPIAPPEAGAAASDTGTTVLVAATPATTSGVADVEMTSVAVGEDETTPFHTPPGAAVPDPEPFDLSCALADMESLDAQAYLPDSISHSTRMLENLLGHAETATLFIERGGLDLLLKVRQWVGGSWVHRGGGMERGSILVILIRPVKIRSARKKCMQNFHPPHSFHSCTLCPACRTHSPSRRPPTRSSPCSAYWRLTRQP